MVLATFVLIGAVIIFFIDGLPLVKKNEKKELVIFSVILFVGVALYIGIIFDLPIPNAFNLIAKLLEPIYKPIVAWIKKGDTF